MRSQGGTGMDEQPCGEQLQSWLPISLPAQALLGHNQMASVCNPREEEEASLGTSPGSTSTSTPVAQDQGKNTPSALATTLWHFIPNFGIKQTLGEVDDRSRVSAGNMGMAAPGDSSTFTACFKTPS